MNFYQTSVFNLLVDVWNETFLRFLEEENIKKKNKNYSNEVENENQKCFRKKRKTSTSIKKEELEQNEERNVNGKRLTVSNESGKTGDNFKNDFNIVRHRHCNNHKNLYIAPQPHNQPYQRHTVYCVVLQSPYYSQAIVHSSQYT